MQNWDEVAAALEAGTLRAAQKNSAGLWQANPEVKQAILQAFANSKTVPWEDVYCDKHTMLPQKFNLDRQVRLVPRGSTVRRGSYLAPGVIVMPPSYINVGVYIDEGTMVDSHVLVGSCAQVGKHVHLSAGVQIGGVLEPIGQTPVIIEDHCFIGAGAVIVEGILVEAHAVIAPGVILSQGLPIYDLVHQQILPAGKVPAGAVVVSGTRPKPNDAWAMQQQISLQCPVIVKYRDQKTSAALALEDALR